MKVPMWPRRKQKPTSYADPKRLADVMALIQVLAQAAYGTTRTEDGLIVERRHTAADLRRTHHLDATWIDLAQSHREFFRVHTDKAGNATMSLISRRVLAKDKEGKRPALSLEDTSKLLELAISLHDRETARRDRWKPWVISVIAASILGVCGLIAAFVKTCPQILRCP